MQIKLISFLTGIMWSYCLATASDASDIFHSFILEFHNNSSDPITIVRINPPALIKKHDIIEAHRSSHVLIVPHTTITVLFNNQLYEIHIRTKEKHPASLTFRYSSHRAYPMIEPKNIKVSIRHAKNNQSYA